MEWLGDLLRKIADTVIEYLLYVPKWLWQSILEALQSLISAIPVPEAFSQFTSNLGGIPSGVVWFLDIMQFQFGLTIIIGAMAARFLMKFIPTLSF